MISMCPAEGGLPETLLENREKEGSDLSVPRSALSADVAGRWERKKHRIGVLASGRGSNFQAIVDAVEDGSVSFEIAILICNNRDAFAIQRAREHSISCMIIDHRGKKREEFDREIDDVLIDAGCDIVVLAGFMRILSPWFVRKWENRIINIHPALLPSFPGAHAHRDALEYGVKITGLTIHFVNEDMDGGPIIFQHPVEVQDDDTEETLSMRVLEKEHHFYPLVIQRILEGKTKINKRRVILEEP